MDWMQFVSSIISAVVWPAVVIYLLYLLRHQLNALAKRLQEISLPGGGGAKFRDEIREAQDTLDTISDKKSGAQIVGPDPKIKELDPRDKIAERFYKLEEQLSMMISELPLDLRKVPSDFIFYDLRQLGSSYPIYDVFKKIRDIRGVAFEAGKGALTERDVVDFDELCNTFLAAFRLQLDEYKIKKVRSKDRNLVPEG